MRVVRYSEQPALWDSIEDLYDERREWQFVLYDEAEQVPLAEGNTIPVSWDGTDAGLGPGIDAVIAGGFALLEVGGTPTALCALAAKVPPANRRRGLSEVLLRAMADLAADAGLAHLIAPVRPNLKERYPTIPIERYVGWRREDGTPFDPWIRVHTGMGARIGPTLPESLRITGTVADWESWTQMRFPETGDYVFPPAGSRLGRC